MKIKFNFQYHFSKQDSISKCEISEQIFRLILKHKSMKIAGMTMDVICNKIVFYFPKNEL